LDEKHILLNGKAISGALADFGLYFFHNAKQAIANGTGPYFYLPKLEHYKEAELWAEVFRYAEEQFGMQTGTIKATVLIEVIDAVFQMEEILHALKEYCVGLNCGRWDYIFSYIKRFAKRSDMILPDRMQVKMSVPFLKAYSELLIKTCHARGAFAMGGMAAAIPVKADEEANAKAFAMVKADKEREANYGHDGTWVAHPGLIPTAMEAFNVKLGDRKNQLDVARTEVEATAADLLAPCDGTITEAGLRNNISVSVIYMANWLSGNGCVPIYNLMEDAATAEIARAQIWQWIHHDAGKLDDGRNVTIALFTQFLEEEMPNIRVYVGEAAFDAMPFDRAAKLLEELVTQAEFKAFLTLPAYEQIN
jgi:malate synthase